MACHTTVIGQGLIGSDSEGTTSRQGGEETLQVEGWETTEVIRKPALARASLGRFAMVTQQAISKRWGLYPLLPEDSRPEGWLPHNRAILCAALYQMPGQDEAE